ncbi:hypothetical protein JX266_011641 [Neoarthrinium moseri]|nr:hypothetical protein JX266_011641 [Neoarthrinium moseri]
MLPQAILKSVKYKRLHAHSHTGGDDADNDENQFLEKEQLTGACRETSGLWQLIALFFCTLTIIFALLYSQEKIRRVEASYEQGWPTDFVSIRGRVGIESKTFTGAPAIRSNGTVYVPHQDGIRYVGAPSPQLDHAWEQLVGGRYFLITEQEAKATWGPDYRGYWSQARGGYVLGLDVFHTLHCLNQIRQKLHPEYYTHEHGSAETKLIHNGHCIEQIRQYIMCAGDLTALGTRYYPGIDRNYVLSDVAHTCRDFQSIRDWTWERYNGSTAVKPMMSGASEKNS